MQKTLSVINDLKKQGIIKDYAIGGAVAALKWVEPFFTRDLDILIIPLQQTGEGQVISFLPIYDALKKRGYDQWTGQWLLIEGVPVEFLPAEGLSKEAIDAAVETDFEGVPTKVVTPEYLIPLFLKAFREKDKMKVRLLLDQAKIDRERLREVLIRHGLGERFETFARGRE